MKEGTPAGQHEVSTGGAWTAASTVMPACRYCGCTDETPCKTEDGDECGRISLERDVCGAKGCRLQYYALCEQMERDKRAQRKARTMPVSEAVRRDRLRKKTARQKLRGKKVA